MKNLQKILQNKQIYQCACKTNLIMPNLSGPALEHQKQALTFNQQQLQHQFQRQQRNVFTFSTLTNKTRQYIKKELVGYSMQQMYDVVSDVSSYYKFVPYVKKSHTHSARANFFRADLIVGFPPLHEVYTSDVSLVQPSMVRAVCRDGRLFNFLLNEWHFSAGLKDIPQSCVIDFTVRFEFKTLLHSNLASIFFDLICDQMEHAFITEARRRYGPAAIKSHVLSSTRH